MTIVGQEVVTQNPREFTVQIRSSRTDEIVGTGFFISQNYHIVTCFHVLKAAAAPNDPWNTQGFSVYLPQLLDVDKRSQTAKIIRPNIESDDDIALLQIDPTDMKGIAIREAILGEAGFSTGREFAAFGYRKLEKYNSGRAFGRILGSIECPEGFNLYQEPIELSSEGIDSGLSGSALLDIERNLVVGIITETWYSEGIKNRDTAWAVDIAAIRVFGDVATLRTLPFPLESPPKPQGEMPVGVLQGLATGHFLKSAPAPLSEWTGREEAIELIWDCYRNPAIRICTIIGFGGQGKTSLTRKWVDSMLSTPSNKEARVFWWTFYNSANIDQFFEQALKFVAGELFDLNLVDTVTMRVQLLASFIVRGHFLFILDGIETLQYPDGDDCGMLSNESLQTFLSLLTSPGLPSFILITSRLPLWDLLMYTTCTSYDLKQFSIKESIRLLRGLKIRGDDQQLVRLAEDWNGHPLTLALIGGLIRVRYDSDVGKLDTQFLEMLRQSEPLNLILQEYENMLSPIALAIIRLLSVFRRSVPSNDVATCHRIFLANQANATTDENQIFRETEHLLSLKVIGLNEDRDYYQVHPLIKNHFYQQVLDLGKAVEFHKLALSTYMAKEVILSSNTTLEQLNPLIEAVYHACRSEQYEEGIHIYLDQIDRRRGFLLFQCGAYDTALNILKDFFVNGDIAKDTLLKDHFSVNYAIRTLGICTMTIGDLQKSKILLTRSYEFSTQKKMIKQAANAIQARGELNIHIGDLDASFSDSSTAIALYRGIQLHERSKINKVYQTSWGVQNIELGSNVQEVCAIAYIAWSKYLRGEWDAASEQFREAINKLITIDPTVWTLLDLWGIYYCDFLVATGDLSAASKANAFNNQYALNNKIREIISQSQRISGDIELLGNNIAKAGKFYELSVREARQTSHKAALIEALIGRAKFSLKINRFELAKPDLNEALKLADTYGYQFYKVDCLLAFAEAFNIVKNLKTTQAYAKSALELSKQIQYKQGVAKSKFYLNS